MRQHCSEVSRGRGDEVLIVRSFRTVSGMRCNLQALQKFLNVQCLPLRAFVMHACC